MPTPNDLLSHLEAAAELQEKATAFVWTGNPDDDCTCVWGDYTLRAELMGDNKVTDDDGGDLKRGGETWREEYWWIAVYFGDDPVMELAADPPICPKTGKQARLICEWFAVAHAARNLPLKELAAQLRKAEAVANAARRFTEASEEIDASIDLRSPPEDHWYAERESAWNDLAAALAALHPEHPHV